MRGVVREHTWRHDPALYAAPRHRRACTYRTFTPYPIADFAETMRVETLGLVTDAQAAVQALNSTARPALTPLARLLLRTESIASSRVEGMQFDARELARAEARAESGGRASPRALEIIRNIDAMELAVEEAADGPLTVDDICRIHRALMSSTPQAQAAGVVRTQQNWIGGNAYNPCGADFVPPPPEDVPALLDDLCAAVGEEHLPALVQAALVHAQFETIHPFGDGNGRTGRTLIHVVLRRRGLAPAYVPPISVVLASDKPAYIRALTEFTDGDTDAWVAAFAVATARAAALASAYLEAVHRLQESWRARLVRTGPPRADAAAWQLIDALPAHPVITLPVAVAAIGRTKAAVNHGLATLAGAGVLIPLSGASRNRTWEAAGLLDLLTDLEAGRPPAADR